MGQVIIDSSMGFEEAIAGTLAPPAVVDGLSLFDVRYYAFDGNLHQGQLVLDRRLEGEIEDIFGKAQDLRFPLAKVIPIVHYAWSDEASMTDNNTSAFNYRFVAGTQRLSRHGSGRAIDINPRQNPVVYADGTTLPPGAVYFPSAQGALSHACPIVEEFLSWGWKWGGDFTTFRDYHHFEKPL